MVSEGCDNTEYKSAPRRTKSFLDYCAEWDGPEALHPAPPTPPKQPSPEDVPLLSTSSASSSPETRKDRPRTGAKTDCALNRLAPSEEDSSWTTLSQDSTSLSSPEEAGNPLIHTYALCSRGSR
ncbi:hypothetical protein AGOR_G00188720 [Albula goreensis]|uniref:Uncharacterized protein n=1 Tax=Albula goreensis TaxID=1534307 RepID=A0A8T3CQ26_9TELE|nr:hypothetical protein AGOR_G00188720 [Albula goreensis]